MRFQNGKLNFLKENIQMQKLLFLILAPVQHKDKV